MIGDVQSLEEKEHPMSVRRLLVAAGAALIGVVGLATPAAAYAVAQPATGAYLTAGRFWSLVAAALGIAGVILGGLAMARSARRIGSGRRGAMAAMAAGLAGVVIGGLVVVAAEGGPGTGYGIVGGFMALAVGLLAMVLGGLAMARSRRTV